MKRISIVTLIVLVLSLGLTAVPVAAQETLTLGNADGIWGVIDEGQGTDEGASCDRWATGPGDSPTAYSDTDPSIQTGPTTDENQVRYGTDGTGGPCLAFAVQSGLGFDGSNGGTITSGEQFELGVLTHYNNPINASNRFTEVGLDITLEFTDPAQTITFEYTVNLDETPNSPCPSPGCPDIIEFANTIPDQEFEIDGVYYTLEILGFIPDCNPSGTPVSQFITTEGQDNTACLYGRISVSRPGIGIVKTADPTTINAGDPVTYTYEVTNTGNEVLSNVTVTDDKCTSPVYVGGDTNTDGKLDLDETWIYECVANPIVDTTNTATATGEPPIGDPVSDTDTADVDVLPEITVNKTADPTSVAEPGDTVTFDVEVCNESGEPVELTSLVDDIHGDLDGQGDCSVPQTIGIGGCYSCSFTADVNGNAGDIETDTVTATAQDDDGNSVEDSDDATVEITDVLPNIITVKAAAPTSIPEPGGPVTFDVEVCNDSVEPVTLTSLVDDIHGDLDGQGDCSVPQTIGIGGCYSCSFTADVNGNAGDSETDTVTATAVDDDGNTVQDSDEATVTITDTPSAIEVIKTADPTSVTEPGGMVTFTVTINNLSSVDSVTIDSLIDSIHGDLNGQGTLSVPQTIPAGGSYTGTFDAMVSGNAGDSETDIVTASGTDDDGNPVSDDDDATVTITDTPSAIEVVKTADPTSVTEPGGMVTFTVTINNLSSVDSVTIDSLIDSIHGDLNGQGTLSVPQTIPAGGSYTGTFDAMVSGNAGYIETDIVTASGTDDDGNPVSDDDDATVEVLDTPSAIEVTKTANPTSLTEPGGMVDFTVVVCNNSAVDSVTIDSLVDSIHGDLNGQGDCAVPQTLNPAECYTCTFSASVNGSGGYVEVDTVTASGTDDDGNPVSDSDDATVTIEGKPPTIPSMTVWGVVLMVAALVSGGVFLLRRKVTA